MMKPTSKFLRLEVARLQNHHCLRMGPQAAWL